MRTLRLTSALAVGLVAGAVMLTGCSGERSNGSATPLIEPARSTEQAGSAPDSAAAGKTGTDGDKQADNDGGAGKYQAGGSNQPSIARAVVRNGSLTVQVKDVEGDDDVLQARQQVSTIVSGLRGVIASESTGDQTSGGPEHQTGGSDGAITRAELVVRIPTDSYDAAVRRLSGKDLGEVKQLKQDSQDVTEQVVDVASRIATQRAGLERMRALLAKARTVSEVITVETELTRREADLESLLARQQKLADQTELATLTVVLVEPAQTTPPPAPADRGFLHGLGKGWDAFSTALTAVATAAGALLPFAVTVAVLALPAWVLLRRQRRTPVPAAAPAPPD